MSNRVSLTSAFLNGTDPTFVDVECAVMPGMPDFRIVGLGGGAEAEAAQVVRCAIRSAGFAFPAGNVLINVSPNALSRHGGRFDLAIAAAILMASGQVPAIDGHLWVGELCLDGAVRPDVRGLLVYALAAREMGMTLVTGSTEKLPGWACESVGLLRGLPGLRSCDFGTPLPMSAEPVCRAVRDGIRPDIASAISERKSVLIIGPRSATRPYVESAAGLLSPLADDESVECAAIASAADDWRLVREAASSMRPCRHPRETVTGVGLMGGGWPVRPGEVTLAHNGTLVLEDVNLFSPAHLRRVVLARQDGHVEVVRATRRCEMPSAFGIVATAQPCSCGNYGNPDAECACSAGTVDRYQKQLRGLGGGMFDEVFHVG